MSVSRNCFCAFCLAFSFEGIRMAKHNIRQVLTNLVRSAIHIDVALPVASVHLHRVYFDDNGHPDIRQ